MARLAIGSFGRELKPLDLPDDDYERVVNESGFGWLNEIIGRIEMALDRVYHL